MNEVYLDYNGLAPLDPHVAEGIVVALAYGVGTRRRFTGSAIDKPPLWTRHVST